MQTTGRFTIDGRESIPPIEAVSKVGETGILIEAVFGAENVQPAITPLTFTFVNQGAEQIRNIVKDGKIFQGVDFSIEVIGDAGDITVLNGYLDLTEGYQEISPAMVKVTAKFKESTTSIAEKADGVSIQLLKDEGALKDSDLIPVDYVVERPVNVVETVIASVAIYLMIKELSETIEKLAEDVNTVLGITASSATGIAGSIVYQIAMLIVRAAYAAIMLKAIVTMVNDLLKKFISPVRQIYSFSLATILRIGFAYLGYGFESPLDDLENFVYVPVITSKSVLSEDIIEKGIPRAGTFGYFFGEQVLLARTYFNAKIAVVNNVVQFRTEKDPYWLKTSTLTTPDVLLEDKVPKTFNTDEMVKSRIPKFEIDDSDQWTLDNSKGLNYSVVTQHTNEVDRKTDGLVGFEYINFNVALGHVKENLNALEITLQILAKTADAVTSIFGSSQNFSDLIERRIGMLKISNESTSIPKLIYYKGGVIPTNHRDLLSAKHSWENFNNYKSFVDNDFNRQRAVYSGVQFGFGLSDFLKLLVNSYFHLDSGKTGKFTNLKWDYISDQVIADFWIQEVYTTKLKELKTEGNG